MLRLHKNHYFLFCAIALKSKLQGFARTFLRFKALRVVGDITRLVDICATGRYNSSHGSQAF